MFASGCGDSGPKRYHVAGKVTWAGRPIPAGVIYFDPDIANGKDGPQGFAIIKDGQFDTRDNGQGHGGGKGLLRITACDGVPGAEAPMGKPLFPEYFWMAELPEEDAAKDFNIPAAAARPQSSNPYGV